MNSPKHFLSLNDLTSLQANNIISRAIELKKMPLSQQPQVLKQRSVALIFNKSSTRTRISFATGIAQFGGLPLFLSPDESHIGRGESISDTAKVLSRMCAAVVIRTYEQSLIEELAQHSTIPIINALTDAYHPCQVLADIQTFVEHRGPIKGHKIAWVGDGNNVCHSWMNAARLFDFKLHIATPSDFKPDAAIYEQNKAHLTWSEAPAEAVENADLVVTDTWASMGQEQEKKAREAIFANYCVDASLMKKANSNALFMHCLPAYRGYEVSAEVIDGPQSVVWDEAENRLHAQKALIEFLMSA